LQTLGPAHVFRDIGDIGDIDEMKIDEVKRERAALILYFPRKWKSGMLPELLSVLFTIDT
jgi:hypothetical protein